MQHSQMMWCWLGKSDVSIRHGRICGSGITEEVSNDYFQDLTNRIQANSALFNRIWHIYPDSSEFGTSKRIRRIQRIQPGSMNSANSTNLTEYLCRMYSTTGWYPSPGAD